MKVINNKVLITVKIAFDLQVIISENLAMVTPDRAKATNSAIPNITPLVNLCPARSSRFN